MAVKQLAAIIALCDKVKRFDTTEEPEASELAYFLSEIESSFEKVAHELIPALLDATSDGPRVCDLLHDIGEEIRHLLYHFNDSRFYAYLI